MVVPDMAASFVDSVGSAARSTGRCRNGLEPDAFEGKAVGSAGRTAMSIIGWLVLGLVAGFIASKLVNNTGEGVVLDTVLGILGAVAGGLLFTRPGAVGGTGSNIYSMFMAVVGAIAVLVLYHALAGRRTL
jgi:uncharacterized membrane protein YeaQ/YmgE (transglycosylase-associated protein family)